MKNLYAFWALLLLPGILCAQSMPGNPEIIDEIVAQVGGEVVLLSNVQENLLEFQNRSIPIDGEASCQVLQQLILQKLLINQAKLDSIVVTDAEVDQQLDARFAQIMSFFNNDPNEFYQYYGKTVDQLREENRRPLQDQLLAQRMESQVVDGITITPSEVVDFYNAIPRDSLPYFNSEVEVREIVYRPQASEEENQRARDELAELRRRIVDVGEDFGELAARYSDDKSSAARNGDLGWAQRGFFVPAFEAEAFKLEPNEVSRVVETEFGYHLIQLLERKGNRIRLRHILIQPAITEDDLLLAREFLDSIRFEIMKDSLSFEEAVQEYSDPNQQSYNNGGRMTNPKTGNTFFEVGDLDPDTYFAIDTLQVGGVSGPIEFVERTGEPLYRLFLLESRTRPHQANLKQDYAKIQEAAKQSKRNRYLSDWFENKISETIIIVDPKFAPCPDFDRYTFEVIRP